MPKYSVVVNAFNPCVSWSGFDIQTKTRAGADKLVEELNRLNDSNVSLKDGVSGLVQEINHLSEARDQLKSELKETRTNRRYWRGLVHRSRGVLADYLEPTQAVHPSVVIGNLLHILDDSAGVAAERAEINMPAWEDPNATHRLWFGDHHTEVRIEGDYYVACSDGKRSWATSFVGRVDVRPPMDAATILDQVASNISQTDPSPVDSCKEDLRDAIEQTVGVIGECEDIIALESLNDHLRKLLQLQLDKLDGNSF